MIRYLKEKSFEEEIQSGITLVDFYADWCGPCRAMGEILETIDQIPILKVNVDEHSDIATKYGVMSIPTIYLFKDGKTLAHHIGMLPKDELIKWIDENSKL